MKVILNGGEELAINSLILINDTELCISFAKVTSYDALGSKLTPVALSAIKYYMNDDIETFTVYEDFVKTGKANITTATDGTLDIAVYFSREDAISKRISLLETALNEIILAK